MGRGHRARSREGILFFCPVTHQTSEMNQSFVKELSPEDRTLGGAASPRMRGRASGFPT